MNSRVCVLLFGSFVLAIAGWAAVNVAGGQTPTEDGKPGSSPQQPVSVSLLQLIAAPDAFEEVSCRKVRSGVGRRRVA